MVYKLSLMVVAIFAYLYGSIWAFNHLNAWIGIGMGVLGGVFLLNQITKLFK